MAAALAVTPISAPPVSASTPSGLPVPSPVKKASSSLLPIRRANSREIYASKSKTLSLSSSSETLIMVPSLYAPIVTWPKLSPLSGIAPSSSTHEAVPLVATTGIFLSPELVWMTWARERRMFSSSNASMSVRSNSSGTR